MNASDADRNVYINWSLYAVLGMMGEADEMMRRFPGVVERVALAASRLRPIAATTLHRGILLEPSVPLETCPLRTFVSWSEDPDVACWFGSPESVISRPLAKTNAKLRGFVVSAPPQRVLFHYSWARGWDKLALAHPDMGEWGARQIAWSLGTQREIITAPIALPAPMPIEEVRARSVADLDAKLTPPWFVEDAP